MAHIASTASATFLALQRGTRQQSKIFPGFSSSRGIRSFLFTNSPRKRLQERLFSSGTNSSNVDIVEISESEKKLRNFAWPDTRKPRVCILGGGFGGLYTALRLESLVWSDDKKPQPLSLVNAIYVHEIQRVLRWLSGPNTTFFLYPGLGPAIIIGGVVNAIKDSNCFPPKIISAISVLLVDQCERFVFKPMLYELLSGEVDEWEIAPRFLDLLANTSVQFLQDRVKLLHPSDNWGMDGPPTSSCGGTVLLESGLSIEYDWLVLALGAESKLDFVPGATEFALPFSTLEDAIKVNTNLKTLERKYFGKDSQISVAVVGCGYSGVELAATVAERLKDKGVVRAIDAENMICPTAPPGNREAALKVLSSRKVELLLGFLVRCIQGVSYLESSDTLTGEGENEGNQALVDDSDKYVLELQPRERGLQRRILEADLVLWTVGSKSSLTQIEPSDLSYPLPLNGRGQAETDETLRVKGHPRIFALGDSSAIRDSHGRILPATAQVAFQQADFAGWNLWAAINGRPLLPFRFQNLGEMMTLGRNDAAISPSFVEGLTFEGPIGHTARKLAYLLRLPTDEHRLKVGISWFTKSAIDSVASLQSSLTKVLSGS